MLFSGKHIHVAAHTRPRGKRPLLDLYPRPAPCRSVGRAILEMAPHTRLRQHASTPPSCCEDSSRRFASKTSLSSSAKAGARLPGRCAAAGDGGGANVSNVQLALLTAWILRSDASTRRGQVSGREGRLVSDVAAFAEWSRIAGELVGRVRSQRRTGLSAGRCVRPDRGRLNQWSWSRRRGDCASRGSPVSSAPADAFWASAADERCEPMEDSLCCGSAGWQSLQRGTVGRRPKAPHRSIFAFLRTVFYVTLFWVSCAFFFYVPWSAPGRGYSDVGAGSADAFVLVRNDGAVTLQGPMDIDPPQGMDASLNFYMTPENDASTTSSNTGAASRLSFDETGSGP